LGPVHKVFIRLNFILEYLE